MAARRADGGAAGPEDCPGGGDEELLRGWYRIYAGMQSVTAELVAELDRDSRLTSPEFQVLWYLAASPERRVPMNEVSRLLGFSTAGTTKLIDRLCASGLVERRASPADRRVSMAELTEAGKRAAQQAASIIADVLRSRFVGPLGEDRVAAIVESFTLLAPAAPDGC